MNKQNASAQNIAEVIFVGKKNKKKEKQNSNLVESIAADLSMQDENGSYTGVTPDGEKPVQDADDL